MNESEKKNILTREMCVIEVIEKFLGGRMPKQPEIDGERGKKKKESTNNNLSEIILQTNWNWTSHQILLIFRIGLRILLVFGWKKPRFSFYRTHARLIRGNITIIQVKIRCRTGVLNMISSLHYIQHTHTPNSNGCTWILVSSAEGDASTAGEDVAMGYIHTHDDFYLYCKLMNILTAFYGLHFSSNSCWLHCLLFFFFF